MEQLKLLLLLLGTIIVSVAVVIGINIFTADIINAEGDALAERDALIVDVNKVAATASSYWRMPITLGGGSRSFLGVTDVTSFGSDSSNINGNFIMSSIMTDKFVLTATGLNEGVIVVATITEQGISGSPAITLP